MFKSNEASWDRIARVALGIILFVLGLTGVVSGALAILLYVLGVILVVTGAAGFCPLYALLKLSTRKQAQH